MDKWNSKRVRELAAKKGWRHTDIAQKIGQTPRSVYAWFAPTPAGKPGKSALILVAHLLGTNVDYLTYQSDDPRYRRIA
jgi:transcriptional regulator with XRE-family HTH domain